MNDKKHEFDLSQLPDKLKKLAKHLSALDTQGGSSQSMEGDMLSLIISGILNGENIAERYPAYYQKLLENAELRKAFLDALESVEAERTGELIPMPGAPQTSLFFLDEVSPAPKVEFRSPHNWQVAWQRTLDEIQAVLFPPQMVYRTDLTQPEEDPWFTLLREEITVENVTYDVILDCTLSKEHDDALSAYINLAVTLGDASGTANFPLGAVFEWGEYHESILLEDEGRIKFPDVPLDSVFNQAKSQLKAGFRLTLKSTS